MGDSRRDIRRLAMQVLYQIDMRGQDDADAIREGLADGHDTAQVADEAFELAFAAWQNHANADELLAELAPKWPTYRQPPVDRAILRLAYHELITGRAPLRVVINEAVELAKQYSSEQSPSFVNGVLDKLARRVDLPPVAEAPADEQQWLDDAMEKEK